LDELIDEFKRTDAIYRESTSRRRELQTALAGLASGQRNLQTSNTVYLKSTKNERVKVEFKSVRQYETALMFDVNELLGKEVFDKLFRTKVEFAAQAANLKSFMKTVDADERIETAKQIIRQAETEVEQSPYVTVVKS
jgi:hypothetical protein